MYAVWSFVDVRNPMWSAGGFHDAIGSALSGTSKRHSFVVGMRTALRLVADQQSPKRVNLRIVALLHAPFIALQQRYLACYNSRDSPELSPQHPHTLTSRMERRTR
jgi:hypothetical protein